MNFWDNPALTKPFVRTKRINSRKLPDPIPIPLPRIDQIIDATAGHDSLCFLDAYSGYHQIKMAESDQAATAFITPYGPFCFNTMLFVLKNAGATYQRMIQTCLEKQIGKIVEAYIDNVVVKTRHVTP